MTRLALVSLTAAAAAALCPIAASAQAPQAQAAAGAQQMVRFGDLNLNSERDARILARRLDDTVDYVCGGQPSSASEHGANADYRACRTETMHVALNAINAPLLTATVEGRRLILLAGR